MKIGIDLTLVTRFSNLDDHFVERFLTEDEQIIYKKVLDKNKKYFLAGRWASKEAIFKALNNSDYLHYAILNDKNGKPYVKDHPEIKISISHDGDYAISMVIVED